MTKPETDTYALARARTQESIERVAKKRKRKRKRKRTKDTNSSSDNIANIDKKLQELDNSTAEKAKEK